MRDGHRLQGGGVPWAEYGESMQALRQEVWQNTSPGCWAFLSIAVCPCLGHHLHGVCARTCLLRDGVDVFHLGCAFCLSVGAAGMDSQDQ